MIERVKNAINSYIYVLKVARKPDKKEFLKTLEISIIFISFIGLLGFVIYLVSIILGV
ncbi:MAG: protein translocase SEC61 complex subunit gamma [Candidatus Aenigmarchaeota archaeon]|nr:protein translocase SEC61 complex subunit gamma [Candidatus Aenigmarchaeota archaeon]